MTFLISLTLAAAFFAYTASAQVPGPMKATAPEKMMPSDKAQKCGASAKSEPISRR